MAATASRALRRPASGLLPRVDRALLSLVDRYDPSSFQLPGGGFRVALESEGGRTVVELRPQGPALVEPARRADTTLTATRGAWRDIAADVRGGLGAFGDGRLHIRGNLHVAVGFLAATAGTRDPARLRVREVRSRAGTLSVLEAGQGEPVVLLHGLGATKASFLPTIAALAPGYRVVAMDLPGFGDSAKPIGAAYDARHLAAAALALMDALDLDRAHVLGHSLGGRVALETGLLHPDRVASLLLLMPSMAWLCERPWAPLLRLLRPELGLLQVAPRAVVERVVRRVVPGAGRGWTALGIDEFLRAYCDPRGRAAFYAAARNIYLEDPHGPQGLWRRLGDLQPPALFVWGRQDTLVPPAFSRHVRRVLPHAEHTLLDVGHVPQFERPDETHAALRRFLAAHRMGRQPARRVSA